MSNFFKNIWVHKAIYAALLLLWTFMLWHGLVSCPKCMSSLGVAYWVAYSPVAMVLLSLLIYEHLVTWLLFFLFSVCFSWMMIFDQYAWCRKYRVKAAWSNWEIGIHVGFIVLMCLVYLLVIYAIRPRGKKKVAATPVSEPQPAEL